MLYICTNACGYSYACGCVGQHRIRVLCYLSCLNHTSMPPLSFSAWVSLKWSENLKTIVTLSENRTLLSFNIKKNHWSFTHTQSDSYFLYQYASFRSFNASNTHLPFPLLSCSSLYMASFLHVQTREGGGNGFQCTEIL